ncbi:conjugal transfer protein TraH (plasmid) [Candidatus Williamhamiltonella defendens]|uniref:Conjugal transfer protein TraH n=2 Tax=Candidatus Williamhamiltonella defendens TaxID=138072 RepID=A0AAC9YHJ8_9ENTR|nr:DotD/TraH family lipoprotein [Candidatus Hamiltonella defensa]ASV34543.1 conjugal transfer protein TraH [Candidatus Hamiltonella defensa]AWK17500.1 conjugal transfer protein TraH [Candidatus Hamiltonella defensa]
MKKTGAFLTGLLLSGCQTPKIEKPAETAFEKAARSISMKQVKLHQSGALHQKRSQFAQPIMSENNRVNVDWQGDALALLAQLARQRGLTFAYSGHRLPLPVNVSVQEMRFDALLRQIETQISCRATLKRHPHSLHLFFSLPEKAGHR